ncbi:helicase associated domain-containing protein [Leucobacter sp. cx-169]|uniref:helicase associated domain-containing protein n=1 Tax=Leucobacter sp. cx-169 TaxID=2770549 RepID=UPI00165DC1A7|nr:helicase associated domain-containing protein [Leucobacter sp. cx-169]MBC9927210.1 helicase associated domain-containing protein [Leucobacter sp. cx-169]
MHVADHQWLLKLDRFESFVAEHGQNPKQRDSDGQRPHLGSWVHGLRQGHSLSPERVQLLNERIPEWGASSGWPDDFEGNLRRLLAFIDERGHLPGCTDTDWEDAIHLGAWLARQRIHANLAHDRERALNEAVPSWRGIDLNFFDEDVECLAKFTAEMGRTPTAFEHGEQFRPVFGSGRSRSDRTSHIGPWLSQIRRIQLTAEQRAKLDRAAPGWGLT